MDKTNQVFSRSIEIEENKRVPNKSNSASKVLQLMDQDQRYSEALEIVLAADPRLDREQLENELNKYC
jgi:hypothetical protein